MNPRPVAHPGGPARTATVVGGGPAGLIAAETLARSGVSVTVLERMPSPARKLLLAGHGGLNLTHSEDRDAFLARYGDAAGRLAPILAAFGPRDLRDWCAELGEPTFVGSSGRVFPRAFRATPLVRAWLTRLDELGVRIERRQRWTGWSAPTEPTGPADLSGPPADASPGALRVTGPDGASREVAGDVAVFALGGASWPRLGSDGGWVGPFTARGVAVTPLGAANVGVRVDWSAPFGERFAGSPVKNSSLRVRSSSAEPPGPSAGPPGPSAGPPGPAAGPPGPAAVRGDLMVTRTGIEGGPVYALGAQIRSALHAGAGCVLEVDLRPDLEPAQLADRLARRRPKDSGSTWLRRTLGLDPVAIALLREAGGGALPAEPSAMAALIKAVALPVTETMPIDRAISTAGGIAWSEVDDSLMLRALPGTFVAGEMLDWEAPTGGYLLQASFSTGVAAARGALSWLGR